MFKNKNLIWKYTCWVYLFFKDFIYLFWRERAHVHRNWGRGGPKGRKPIYLVSDLLHMFGNPWCRLQGTKGQGFLFLIHYCIPSRMDTGQHSTLDRGCCTCLLSILRTVQNLFLKTSVLVQVLLVLFSLIVVLSICNFHHPCFKRGLYYITPTKKSLQKKKKSLHATALTTCHAIKPLFILLLSDIILPTTMQFSAFKKHKTEKRKQQIQETKRG